MKPILLGLLACALPLTAGAAESCRGRADAALTSLKDQRTEPELRASLGTCLVRHYLDRSEVALSTLKIIQDTREDLFLREDLVRAFGEARLRRQVKLEQSLMPDMEKQDHDAVARTVSSAGSLLAVAEAVKSMDDTVPVCAQEEQFVKALAELSGNDETPVVLRSAAVETLEKVVGKIVGSGVYQERSLRTAQESLRAVAGRDDSASFLTGASSAYGRLATAGLPYFSEDSARGGRALASDKR